MVLHHRPLHRHQSGSLFIIFLVLRRVYRAYRPEENRIHLGQLRRMRTRLRSGVFALLDRDFRGLLIILDLRTRDGHEGQFFGGVLESPSTIKSGRVSCVLMFKLAEEAE